MQNYQLHPTSTIASSFALTFLMVTIFRTIKNYNSLGECLSSHTPPAEITPWQLSEPELCRGCRGFSKLKALKADMVGKPTVCPNGKYQVENETYFRINKPSP